MRLRPSRSSPFAEPGRRRTASPAATGSARPRLRRSKLLAIARDSDTVTPVDARRPQQEPAMSQHASIASKWFWFFLLGLITLAAGVFAIGHPALVTLASVIFIGAALLVGGIAQIIHAAIAREWSGFPLAIIGGLLSIVGGVLIMQEPIVGSLVITSLLALALIIGGVMRLVIALRHRELAIWWLLALSGLVGIAVGVALYALMPWSGLWVLGTLIGIELIMQGAAWIGISLHLRKHAHAA